MQRSLLDILVDPVSKTPLRVQTDQAEDTDDIVTGVLKDKNGKTYPVANGIPRFVLTDDSHQQQTAQSFGFKWQQQHTYDSPQVFSVARQWLLERYGFETINHMQRFFTGRQRILDAGCGSGFSSSLWLDASWRNEGQVEWIGADISMAIDVAQGRLGSFSGTHFVQADILQLPFREQAFDTIFSEGVLHHTPSTEAAFKSLVPLLKSNGQIMFYVYRQKAPVREFTDDYIRNKIASLEPEEAWAALRPLTKLGQSLANLQTEVDVPEDIPLLGIKAGRYDLQRLIYWHFAKMFWNQAFDFEANNHVNFDWYHPRYAHRHTEDEIRCWCREADLDIIHFNIQESGFTVRAVKK
jgi:ubiquinone/menaquinone biosynthesis C-methylase UbiE